MKKLLIVLFVLVSILFLFRSANAIDCPNDSLYIISNNSENDFALSYLCFNGDETIKTLIIKNNIDNFGNIETIESITQKECRVEITYDWVRLGWIWRRVPHEKLICE